MRLYRFDYSDPVNLPLGKYDLPVHRATSAPVKRTAVISFSNTNNGLVLNRNVPVRDAPRRLSHSGSYFFSSPETATTFMERFLEDSVLRTGYLYRGSSTRGFEIYDGAGSDNDTINPGTRQRAQAILENMDATISTRYTNSVTRYEVRASFTFFVLEEFQFV